MSYATELAAISNKSVDFVKLTLDTCSRNFGIAPCAPGNLITNGDMEGSTGWANYGPSTSSYSSTQKHSGAQSRKIVSGGANSGTSNLAVPWTTITGHSYRVQFWVYPDDTTDCRYFVWFGDGSALILSVTPTGLTQDAWNSVTFDYTETLGGAIAAIALVSTGAGTWYYDDVYITDLTLACYNTYFTCKDRANYLKTTKDYKFTSSGAVPFRTGERPYIKSLKALSTEIKDSQTVVGRETVTLLDEPDGDIGIDPYYLTRTSIQGTYFKKLLARNPNYRGRPYKRYHGFIGLAEGDFVQKFEGVIDKITRGKNGEYTFEAKDNLAALEDIYVPRKFDISLIGDEIILYAAKSGDTLTGLVRASGGTAPEVHNVDAKVQEVVYMAPASPYVHMVTLLEDYGGLTSANVSEATYTALTAWDDDMVQMAAWLHEPENLFDLYFELVDLTNCKSWQGEDLKSRSRRTLPTTRPGPIPA
jgi:hypothetical protein